jgi:hypothetical protein
MTAWMTQAATLKVVASAVAALTATVAAGATIRLVIGPVEVIVRRVRRPRRR